MHRGRQAGRAVKKGVWGERERRSSEAGELPTHPSIFGDPEWQKAGEGAWTGAWGGGPGSWFLLVLEFRSHFPTHFQGAEGLCSSPE